MNIAYTVGNTYSYDKALLEDPDIKKIGKTDTYPGGWVWKTPQEAKAFLTSDHWATIDWGDGKPRDAKKFSVYVLQLPNNWEEDTYTLDSYTGSNQLLIDAKILGKYEE